MWPSDAPGLWPCHLPAGHRTCPRPGSPDSLAPRPSLPSPLPHGSSFSGEPSPAAQLAPSRTGNPGLAPRLSSQGGPRPDLLKACSFFGLRFANTHFLSIWLAIRPGRGEGASALRGGLVWSDLLGGGHGTDGGSRQLAAQAEKLSRTQVCGLLFFALKHN